MSETPTYEQARDELVSIVSRLEAGTTTLAESIELWERGEQLAKVAQQHLDGVRARLDAVIGADDDQTDTARGRNGD